MDARAAIDEGYLVPVRSYAVATETNLDERDRARRRFRARRAGQGRRQRRTQQTHPRGLHAPDPGSQGAGLHGLRRARAQRREDVPDAGLKRGLRERRNAAMPNANGSCANSAAGARRARELRPVLEGFDVPRHRGDRQRAAHEERHALHADHRARLAARGRIRVRHLELPLARSAPRDDLADAQAVRDRDRHRRSSAAPSDRHAAFLWGMPSQIDAQGELVSQVADEYEKLYKRDPARRGARAARPSRSEHR